MATPISKRRLYRVINGVGKKTEEILELNELKGGCKNCEDRIRTSFADGRFTCVSRVIAVPEHVPEFDIFKICILDGNRIIIANTAPDEGLDIGYLLSCSLSNCFSPDKAKQCEKCQKYERSLYTRNGGYICSGITSEEIIMLCFGYNCGTIESYQLYSDEAAAIVKSILFLEKHWLINTKKYSEFKTPKIGENNHENQPPL